MIADEKAAQTVRRLIENYISEQQLHLPGYDMSQLADRLYGDMAGFGFLDNISTIRKLRKSTATAGMTLS